MEFAHFKYLVEHIFTSDDNGVIKARYAKLDAKAMNPLVLAYIGDAYFSLYVRGRLLAYEQNKVQVLNSFGAQIVSAVWQSIAYKAIEAELTDEERDVFRRGRNAKSHVPKSATVAEYRASTGFEALLGTLYIEKKFARLEEIAAKSFDVISKEMMKKINEKKK
jgi:ribonuclease-3 family protein